MKNSDLKVNRLISWDVENDLIYLQVLKWGKLTDDYFSEVEEREEKSHKGKVEQRIKESSEYALEFQKQLQEQYRVDSFCITLDDFSEEIKGILDKS